jgi:hypothetical protein
MLGKFLLALGIGAALEHEYYDDDDEDDDP